MLHSPLSGIRFPGVLPSFNQNHPAARNPRMINVAVNGGVRNLLTNKVYGCFDPTVVLPNEHGILGRTVYGPAITAARVTVGIPAVIPNENLRQATIAAIWKMPPSSQYQGGGSVVNDNWEMDQPVNTRPFLNINASVNPSTQFITLQAGGSQLLGLGAVQGHSYFVAATLNNAASLVQMIIRDMTTGNIIYLTTNNNYFTQTGTRYSALTYNATAATDPHRIAANMLSASTLSPAQLWAWAQDPWSLWYKPASRRTLFLGTPPGTNLPLGSFVDLGGSLGSSSTLHGDISTTTSPFVELAGALTGSFSLTGTLTGADSVFTQFYLWQKPIVGASDDVWGTILNSDLDAIDSVVHTLNAGVPAASTAPPQMDGIANPGNATTFATGNHVHPSDTTRAAVTALPQPANTNPNMAGASPAPGTDAHYSRADHVHPSDTSLGSGALPVANGVAAAGSHSLYSRDDHVHPTDTTLLPLAGGTVTGVLNIAPAPGNDPTIILSKPATGVRETQLIGSTGTGSHSIRWIMNLGDNVSESGSNAGSNFSINNFSDTSVYLGAPFTINRASGAVNAFGTSTNDSAASGFIGEYLTATTGTGTVSLPTNTAKNIVSLSLTAGDWDVDGQIEIFPATGATDLAAVLTLTSGVYPLVFTPGRAECETGSTIFFWASPVGPLRVSIAVTTTVYLVAEATYTSGSGTAQGYIRARRVR